MQFLRLLLLLPFLLVASPSSLELWREYLLEKQEGDSLPFVYNNHKATVPLWQGPLEIEVHDSLARFSLDVVVYAKEQWVALPGKELWPQSVLNGKGESLVVLSKDGVPHLLLQRGEHSISGELRWEKAPKEITVPRSAPLVHLIRKSGEQRTVSTQSGIVLLNERIVATSKEQERNTVEMKLYRMLSDGVPQTVTSRLKLVVTGTVRDQDLGQLLPAGSEIVSLRSPLPAVVTPSGLLRVQLKPGMWEIVLVSRCREIGSTFSVTGGGDEWPEQEVWSFVEDSRLRSVVIEGVNQIDPSQTDMFESWKKAPAFLLGEKDTMRLIEKSRGDEQPTPNQFSLHRTFYLDFDGSGFTILENMNGSVYRASELSMQDPYQLGSATLKGKPHLVIEGDNGIGVQVPAGQLSLKTVNRLEKHEGEVSASGWNMPMESVSGKLHLPPGWDLFHVMGVDGVEGSRLDLWSLWDLFLFLIIIVLLFRLFNVKWALLGLVGCIILFHAEGVPRVIWLNLLITIAILRQLPTGVWKKAVSVYYIVVLLICGTMLFVLSVRTLREVIYPQVHRDNYYLFEGMGYQREVISPDFYAKKMESGDSFNETPVEMYDSAYDQDIVQKNAPQKKSDYVRKSSRGRWKSSKLKKIKSDDIVQTGPGKPTWSWNSFSLSWDGPVEPSQKIRFLLIPPIVMRVLKFIAIVSLLGLFVRFVLLFKEGKMKDSLAKGERGMKKATQVLLPFLLVLITATSLSAGEYPPQYLFDSLQAEIEREVKELPPCYPHCVSVEEVSITVGDSTVEGVFIVHAKQSVAFPLLEETKEWAPEKIETNGSPLCAKKSGAYTVLLKEGINTIVMSGKAGKQQMQFTFVPALHNVTVEAPLWKSSGLEKRNLPGGTLQFVKREVKREESTSSIGEQALAKSYVEVSRHLYFGREQYIETRLRRIAPLNTPLDVKVHLLDYEAVLTPDVKVENDSVLITVPADADEVFYTSRLPMVDKLVLRAPEDYAKVEEWSIQSDHRYKVSFAGVLPVKNQNLTTETVWRPRKGDSLVVSIMKPKAVVGKTVTFERVSVSTTAGKNSRSSALILRVNSSKGEPLKVTLPEGATVESMKIDQKVQVFNQKENSVLIPLHPGIQNVEMSWKESKSFTWKTKTPKVILDCDGANISLTYTVPRSRWILALGGPLMGPSMLIWGILLFFVGVALVMPKVIKTPLGTIQWILLLLGVSSVHYIGAIPVIIWFTFFSLREQYKGPRNSVYFNAVQLVLIASTALLFLSLAIAIPAGLLSSPDMYIVGNGSSAYDLRWYSDRSTGALPEAWIISLPLWVYRIIRLLWAVWLALMLPQWLKWGWSVIRKDGFWEKSIRRVPVKKPMGPQK